MHHTFLSGMDARTRPADGCKANPRTVTGISISPLGALELEQGKLGSEA